VVLFNLGPFDPEADVFPVELDQGIAEEKEKTSYSDKTFT
jgi:hypothetical protein